MTAAEHDAAIRAAIVAAIHSGQMASADVWEVVDDAIEEARSAS